MTASRTEQILLALQAALISQSTVANGRVYRDRAEAFLRAECPAVLIEPRAEPWQGETTCRTDRLLTVEITIAVRDGAVSLVSDPIRSSIHDLIYSDATLQGLVSTIRLSNTQWSTETGDGLPGVCVLTYQFGLRTLTADLTA